MKKTPARLAATFAPARGTGLIAVSLALSLPFLLGGCGSGSGRSPIINTGAGSVSRARGSATFTVKWPAPTRVIPKAANSIVLTLTRVNPGPSVVPVPAQILTRPAANQPLTTSATFNNLELGDYVITATALPQCRWYRDCSGDRPANPGPVGAAQAPVTVKAGGNTPLTVTMFATVNTLTLTPNPPASLRVGQTEALVATTFDAASNVVITDGSIVYTSSNPAVATVSSTGVVTAVSFGRVTITATYSEAPNTPVGSQGNRSQCVCHH